MVLVRNNRSDWRTALESVKGIYLITDQNTGKRYVGSAYGDDTEATINTMHELKRLGISLSLDDFGTGWSSLSYLRRFPLDRLKIDRAFIRDLAEPGSAAVIRSIVSLARNLDLACVAEGVGTPEQFRFLQKQMCGELQTYFYSQPCRSKSARRCYVAENRSSSCYRMERRLL